MCVCVYACVCAPVHVCVCATADRNSQEIVASIYVASIVSVSTAVRTSSVIYIYISLDEALHFSVDCCLPGNQES